MILWANLCCCYCCRYFHRACDDWPSNGVGKLPDGRIHVLGLGKSQSKIVNMLLQSCGTAAHRGNEAARLINLCTQVRLQMLLKGRFVRSELAT